MGDVSITYEKLYALLRAEKENQEVQVLDSAFYAQVVDYITEKSKILDDTQNKSDLFSAAERENTVGQLKNVRRLLKELYSRRESKIISLALNKSRTDSDIIDTSHLLPEEMAMYSYLLEVLGKFRKGVHDHIAQCRMPFLPGVEVPQVDDRPSGRPQVEDYPTKEDVMYPKPDPEAVDASGEAKEAGVVEAPPETPKEGKLTIKFLQETSKFVGKELEIYGPYNAGDISTLPEDIAKVLISRGSAQEI